MCFRLVRGDLPVCFMNPALSMHMHVFCTEVLSQQAKDRNKRKKCSVIARITRKPILRCCKSKERPCSATWSRGMQAAAASLSAHCTMLQSCSCTQTQSFILL